MLRKGTIRDLYCDLECHRCELACQDRCVSDMDRRKSQFLLINGPQ